MTRIDDGLAVGVRQRLGWWPGAVSLAAVREWVVAHAATFVLLAAFGAGLAVRAYYAFRDRFPVNDGGLFYEMARDLQRAHYVLPRFTEYNGGEIPFVYPPLTIYLAALGDSLTPASLQAMFSIVPFVGVVFALWAFYRLADALFPMDRWTVAVATMAFALAPRSFIWLIMGGGLPRGFGLAFALLAIREGYLLTKGPASRRRVVTCGAFAALTALAHLETATFLAFSMGLFALVRPRTGIPRLAMAGAVGAALFAPWLLAMVAIHGVGPFIAAMHEGGRLVQDGSVSTFWAEAFLRTPVHTSEAYFPIIGALGLVGALYALIRGDWLIPVWWLTTGLLGMRAFPTYVTVATCLMAGYAIGQLIVPELSRRASAVPSWRKIGVTGAVAAFCLWATATGAVSYNRGEVGAFLHSLPVADRTAMAWVDRTLPEDATFAVVPMKIWPGDYPAEWFPALAQRESLTTPQGYEWVPDAFGLRVAIHDVLLGCSNQDHTCLTDAIDWLDAEYVYIPSECCGALKRSIRASSTYAVLYDSEAVVAERVEAPLVPSPTSIWPDGAAVGNPYP